MRHLLLALLFIQFLPAQDALFPAYDLRSRATGGTGLTATGIDAVWTNPAGLARAGEFFSAAATAEQRFGLTEFQTITGGAVLPTDFGGFALQLANFGWSSYGETRIGVGYGRLLSDNFSIGAELTGFATQTEGYESTFDLTFGLGFQLTVTEEIYVGARVFSPLRIERAPDEDLPQLLAVGGSYRPSDKLRIDAEAHLDAEFPVRVRVGATYLPAEQLEIMLGVTTSEAELSFGLGYQVLSDLRIRAAAVYHETLDLSPAIGLVWRG